MTNREIRVDFEKKIGRVKPLHCINGGPRSGGYDLPFDFSDEFTRLGIPLVRTVGSAGEYGLNQFINIHCIFPDFDADENLEESYNFLPTDLYLDSIKNTGAEIFYRLGESPEPYSRKIYARPPKDIEKWARICEHVIMHYNEGWANGFKLGIKFFEIWSAPDSAEGFVGDANEYFELYRITANYLRERFPKIKIGAYGARGFYALNRLDATEEMKHYVPYLQKFLAYITAEATAAPLDFFTWACYTSNPDEILIYSKYARNYLDNAGLRRTRSIICEYNTVPRSELPPALDASIPSELGVALIVAQKSPVDMMIYSSSDIFSRGNTLFTMDDHVTTHRYAASNVIRSFSRLYRLGNVAESSDDLRKEVYSLAAFNENEAAMLIVTRKIEGKIDIILNGAAYNTCAVSKTVGGGDRGQGAVLRSKEFGIIGGKITLPVNQNEVYLLTLVNR